MAWSIIFKTYKDNQIIEEGFDTSMEYELNQAISEIDDILVLDDVDKIELTIVKTDFKQD